ncbi:putative pterin-4-alpha-carbinolamine dehydratase [Croceivirga lutea]|uniref:4a-hydroxytetrahydrobiopterin dehydratase n=1 Tax=Croceivirga lutea TaxID=1775167 RepID=UPI00163AC619|nr:4a-hydroxytetrahydrobiopterin dehydratase [Croceivirga lutea]GGG57090.1 putative pterin-4-alpha-carbinolamine dehydratase [Croceivirga lutea]
MSLKKLSTEEIKTQLIQLSNWEYNDECIEKTFTYADFKTAFAVMTRIAFEAEAQSHHPDWTNVYNTLVIKLNTHDAGGVTQKDIDLAHAIEKINTRY